MIGRVGPYDNLTGHKRMEISANLGTAEYEFTRFICGKFDFRHLVPVSLFPAVFIFPGIFLKRDSLLFDDKFNGVSIQIETVGHVL